MNSHLKPTPTLIWYYYICKREVWLLSRQLEPYQSNPFIEIGKLISEESYKRQLKEIHLENMVIDLLKTEGKDVVVAEVKKSSKYKKAAKMQLAYYLLRLKAMGIEAKGELLFPLEKKKITVELTPEIEEELKEVQDKIKQIILNETAPFPKKIKFCNKCGYQQLCWA